MTKFTTEVSLTSRGTIDVQATLASVETALTAAAKAESEQFVVLEQAVDAAIEARPELTICNLETLVHYALGELAALPANEVPEVTRQLKTLIRNSSKFTMARGKNGGVKVNSRQPAPSAAPSAEA